VLTSASSVHGWDGLSFYLEKLAALSATSGIQVASDTLSHGFSEALYVCLADGYYLFTVSGSRSTSFSLGWIIEQASSCTSLDSIEGSSFDKGKFATVGGCFVQVLVYYPILSSFFVSYVKCI